MPETLVEEKTEGEEVRTEKASNDERNDGIEGDGGPNIDEREEAGDEGGEADRVEGKLGSRFDLLEKTRSQRWPKQLDRVEGLISEQSSWRSRTNSKPLPASPEHFRTVLHLTRLKQAELDKGRRTHLTEPSRSRKASITRKSPSHT